MHALFKSRWRAQFVHIAHLRGPRADRPKYVFLLSYVLEPLFSLSNGANRRKTVGACTYHSKMFGQTEELPVVISIVGEPGTYIRDRPNTAPKHQRNYVAGRTGS